MGKVNRIQSNLLIGVLVITSLSVLPVAAAIRQSTRPFLTGVNGTYLVASWGEIWGWLRGKKGAGGSRDGEGSQEKHYCMIVPGKLWEINRKNKEQDGIREVWSNQPLFFWQGTMVGIKVWENRTDKLMWNQPLEQTLRTINYSGEDLQPGKAYYWRLELSPGIFSERVDFQIMNEAEQERIKVELEEMDKKLKAENTSSETIALERVNYFASRQLWSDALREIYSQSHPDPDLIKDIEAHDFCPKPEDNVSASW